MLERLARETSQGHARPAGLQAQIAADQLVISATTPHPFQDPQTEEVHREPATQVSIHWVSILNSTLETAEEIIDQYLTGRDNAHCTDEEFDASAESWFEQLRDQANDELASTRERIQDQVQAEDGETPGADQISFEAGELFIQVLEGAWN